MQEVDIGEGYVVLDHGPYDVQMLLNGLFIRTGDGNVYCYESVGHAIEWAHQQNDAVSHSSVNEPAVPGGYSVKLIKREYYVLTNPVGEVLLDEDDKPREFGSVVDVLDLIRSEFTHSNESIVAESDIITKEQ